MAQEIIIVSGLPRSGTSLMMRMLDAGGLDVLTDQARQADIDNPRGYYEYEKTKRLKDDASWIPQARGKVLKAVSKLLYALPAGERYKILFMERDLDEILDSQERMLERLGRQAAPRADIRRAFQNHVEALMDWLEAQPAMEWLPIRYDDLICDPESGARRAAAFLEEPLDVAAMVAVVEPALYRNRREEEETGHGDRGK